MTAACPHCGVDPEILLAILAGINRIERSQEKIMTEVQTDIDNAVSVLTGFFADFGTQLTTISGELSASGADTSKLDALIATVPAAQAQLDALAAPPAAPAAPAPSPSS